MKSKPIETSEALDKALEEIKKCEEKEQMNDEMNDKMSDEMNNEVNNMDEMNEQELNDFFGDDTDSFTDTQTGEFKPDRRFCEVAESSLSNSGGKASAMASITSAELYGERLSAEGLQLLITAYQLGIADSLSAGMTAETVA